MGRTSDARQRLMDAAYALIWEYSYGAITIEAICERAAVKKGSFYYFFASKSDLAIAAIETWWNERRALMEQIFRPENPPLERIRQFMDFISRRQIESFETKGHILGCPLHALAAEMSTQDERLRSRLHAILEAYATHFRTAIGDAQALGQVDGSNPEPKARALLAYYAGILCQARIAKDPSYLQDLGANALALIGARKTPSVPALFSERPLRPVAPDEQLVPSR